jgi:TRAP-type mannitol/chloroaromatic compound transport system permease small subunit
MKVFDLIFLDSCNTCSDIGCIFIKRGYITVSQPGHRNNIIQINQTCWKALPVFGVLLDSKVHSGQDIEYQINVQESYYANCGMREFVYWIVISISFFLLFVIFVAVIITCICCFCGTRKNYRRIN